MMRSTSPMSRSSSNHFTTTMTIVIRPETAADIEAVRNVNRSAFPTALESNLVDALRHAGDASISLVADVDGFVVGHILFSPVTIDAHPIHGLGLAPVAVLPDVQNSGIGSYLIREGLDRARGLEAGFVVVLGEPDYYGRFGFIRASDFGLDNEYGVDDPFMVMALRDDALHGITGLVRYSKMFAMVDH